MHSIVRDFFTITRRSIVTTQSPIRILQLTLSVLAEQFFRLLITFANSLDPDQIWSCSGSKPFDTPIVFLKEFFFIFFFKFFMSQTTFFNHVRTGLPGLTQY